ncbi:TPA: recombinase RecA [Serratia marcescens]|nr:recombinase RecA [Serratia marcescens]
MWTEYNKVHCWRNYAPKQLRDIWHTFSDEQKKHIAFTLQTIADNEHWD